MSRWQRQPLQVQTDPRCGGRWSSLRTPWRQWLWHNPAVTPQRRENVAPGDAFVDAGGVEECFPSVVGRPDHGDVWSREWHVPAPQRCAVQAGELSLERTMLDDEVLRVAYRLTGPPGAGVLHAVHMLLDLSPQAVIDVASPATVSIQDWPADGRTTASTWPDGGGGVRLDRLGPDDGTARCAVVRTDAVTVTDGSDRLSMRWGTACDAPVSLVVWRNLGGWPEAAPYRSVGIEPLLGAATDRDRAEPGELARFADDGALTWWLEIESAHQAGHWHRGHRAT